jgi:hypothetical protein
MASNLEIVNNYGGGGGKQKWKLNIYVQWTDFDLWHIYHEIKPNKFKEIYLTWKE